MVLNHDSGLIEGKCLKGRFAGRTLSSLSCNELFELLRELRATDAQGVLLLEAYLDRKFHDWRESNANHAKKEEPRDWHERRHSMSVNDTMCSV
jgi:hypothetical protein